MPISWRVLGMLSDDSDDVHLESTASRYRWLRAPATMKARASGRLRAGAQRRSQRRSVALGLMAHRLKHVRSHIGDSRERRPDSQIPRTVSLSFPARSQATSLRRLPAAPDVARVANSSTEVLSVLSVTRHPSRSSASTARACTRVPAERCGEITGPPISCCGASGWRSCPSPSPVA
jgi:hypothetical protein